MHSIDIPVLVMKLATTMLFHCWLQQLSSIAEVSSSQDVPQKLRVAHLAAKLANHHFQKSKGLYGAIYTPVNCKLAAGEVRILCGNIQVTAVPHGVPMVSAGQSGKVTITPALVSVDNYMKQVEMEITNTCDFPLLIKK